MLFSVDMYAAGRKPSNLQDGVAFPTYTRVPPLSLLMQKGKINGGRVERRVLQVNEEKRN